MLGYLELIMRQGFEAFHIYASLLYPQLWALPKMMEDICVVRVWTTGLASYGKRYWFRPQNIATFITLIHAHYPIKASWQMKANWHWTLSYETTHFDFIDRKCIVKNYLLETMFQKGSFASKVCFRGVHYGAGNLCRKKSFRSWDLKVLCSQAYVVLYLISTLNLHIIMCLNTGRHTHIHNCFMILGLAGLPLCVSKVRYSTDRCYLFSSL